MLKNVTRDLASFTVQTDFAALPDSVVQQAKKCFMDWLGVALRGSQEPLANILHNHVALVGGNEQATVLGKGLKTSAINAALVNGAASHAMDYDDVHYPSLLHPSTATFAAVLAACEWKGLSGRDLIAGYVIGFDVQTRIGMTMHQRIHEGGRHATANMAPFGTAAAAANLLGLSVDQTIMALGIAGTQAAGLVKSFGTMCKPLHPGKAAMNGLQAALLAQQGYTGADEIIEGDGGIVQVLVGDADLSVAVGELGSRFEVMNNSFKAYAACGMTHPPIDAIREIRRKYKPDPVQVEEIVCRGATLLPLAAGKPEPRTALEGKFSVQYCVSVALVEGEATEDRFTNAKVNDQLLAELTRRTRIETDPTYDRNEAMVIVRMKDGTVYSEKVDTCTGTPVKPMSEEGFETKFRSLACSVLSEKKLSQLIDAIWNLDEIENVSTLANLCW